MKQLILSLATVFAICVLASSCGKDACYDCTLSLLGTSTTESFCEGDVVQDTTGADVTLSKSDVESTVAALEALGADCTKK